MALTCHVFYFLLLGGPFLMSQFVLFRRTGESVIIFYMHPREDSIAGEVLCPGGEEGKRTPAVRRRDGREDITAVAGHTYGPSMGIEELKKRLEFR